MKSFPILYFAFHGGENCIYLGRNKKAYLNDIAEIISDSCKGSVIFFASCETLNSHKAHVKRFLNDTMANAAIGYRSEVNWIKATAFEMLLFDAIQIHTNTKRGLKAFEKIVANEFGQLKRELEFRMVIRE